MNLKDIHKKRNQRLNLVIPEDIKSGFNKVAAIYQISLNELANRTFEKLIKNHEKQIAEYDKFIASINPMSNKKDFSNDWSLNPPPSKKADDF